MEDMELIEIARIGPLQGVELQKVVEAMARVMVQQNDRINQLEGQVYDLKVKSMPPLPGQGS
jgi:hypothetical protein